MANALVTNWLNGQLGKSTYTPLDFETPGGNGFKLALIDHGTHTPLPASDTYYSDFNAGILTNGLSTALGTLDVGTIGAGVFDAANMTPGWTSVSGNSAESLNLIRDTGTAATSEYIAYWDTGVTGIPLTPNGGDVNITFSGSGILKI